MFCYYPYNLDDLLAEGYAPSRPTIPYGSFNKVSKVAKRREEQARERFDRAKKDFDESNAAASMRPGDTHVVDLLEPKHHLTSFTWRSFRKYVCSNDGWSVKRRKATDVEKRASGEVRKGRVWFVSVVYMKPWFDEQVEQAVKKRKVSENQMELANSTCATSINTHAV